MQQITICRRLLRLVQGAWHRADLASIAEPHTPTQGSKAKGHPTFDRLMNGETITLTRTVGRCLRLSRVGDERAAARRVPVCDARDVETRLQWADLVDLTKDLPADLAILMLDDLELGLWVPEAYMEDMTRKWLSNN